MSLTLRQVQGTSQRLDVRDLLPGPLSRMDSSEMLRLPLQQGNRRIPLAELFRVEQDDADDLTLIIIPLDHRLDFVGANMSEGHIILRGDAGDYAGRAMSGGKLTISGNAGDFAGSGLSGGQLIVLGNAGDRVGAPVAGERQGQKGGFIHIHGDAGARAGERQRRGTLFVEGDSGDLLGHRMIAGTVYVGGQAGAMAGYGMRRGSLVLRQSPRQICPNMRANGHHQLAITKILLDELQRLSGKTVGEIPNPSKVERFLGDMAYDGRGEILILN